MTGYGTCEVSFPGAEAFALGIGLRWSGRLQAPVAGGQVGRFCLGMRGADPGIVPVRAWFDRIENEEIDR
jgi:hypothetical protein